jgi:23S rRNA (cytidine1920-2'-O)/16S rRNA (cytidine1409-2'-O)-methyltransferase
VIGYAVGIGFRILNLDYSPIKGPEGNIEYLLHMKKSMVPLIEEDVILPQEEIVYSMEQCNEYVDNEKLSNLTLSIQFIVNSAHNTLNLY